jgi:hypothetical protein
MSWQLLAIILVLLFGFVLLFGAPYVPTLKPQTEQALDLQAEGVFIFMIDRFMPRLNKRFEAYARDAPLRVVSFAYKIPNKKIIRSKKGIHLYEY